MKVKVMYNIQVKHHSTRILDSQVKKILENK